jgi:hypothetical protein
MKKTFAIIVAALALSSTAFAGGNYKLDVKAPASAKKGEKATTMIHIEGTGKYHINDEYPTKLPKFKPEERCFGDGQGVECPCFAR